MQEGVDWFRSMAAVEDCRVTWLNRQDWTEHQLTSGPSLMT